MKYTIAVMAMAVGAMAGLQQPDYGMHPSGNSTGYTTITTTAITTYCPEPTIITHGDKQYTVTEATTLTITDCPCTVVKPIETKTPVTVTYTSCPPTTQNNQPVQTNTVDQVVNTKPQGQPANTQTQEYQAVNTKPANVATNDQYSPVAPCSTCNEAPAGTGAYTSKAAEFTGAANANNVGGLFVGALAGVVAFAL